MDDGDSFRYVQRYQLDKLKKETKGLHEISLSNLAKLAQEKLRIFPHGAIHGLLLDGQFEASLTLLDDLWEHSLQSILLTARLRLYLRAMCSLFAMQNHFKVLLNSSNSLSGVQKTLIK